MTNQKNKRPLINPYDVVGEIPLGERETTLSQQPGSAPSHRRETRSTPEPQAEADDLLMLPRGALVAMRKSGGLAFSTREVVVYRDGRVVQRSAGTGRARQEQSSERLTADQIDELVVLLNQVRFPQYGGNVGQSSDTLVIELSARVGRKLKRVEVSSAHLSEGLAPLVRWLDHLAARSDAEQ